MIQIHPKVEQMGGVKWDASMTDAAARSAKVYQEKMNKGRRLPKRLNEVEEISKAKAVHIFNVGPFNDPHVFLGSWGQVHIPACPKGVDYVYVCEVPGIFMETIPGEDKFEGEDISGNYIAQEILGEGPDLRNYSGESRRNTGLFIGSVRGPAGATPLREEVLEAQAAVNQYLYDLVLEANGAWGTGNDAEFKSRVGSKHYLAAELTGQTGVPWFKAKVAPPKAETIPCDNCGEQRNPKYPTCQKCNMVIDRELYNQKFGNPSAAPVAATPVAQDAPVKSEAEIELERARAENERLKAGKGK